MTRQYVSNSRPGEPLTFTLTTFEYDNRNRLTRVNSFEGNTLESFVEYRYDQVGNLLEMRAANGANITRYEYDSYNRVIRITDALGQFETFTYDRNGNVRTHTDRNGTTVTNTYDALNRLTNVTARRANGISAPEFKRFTYAATGAVISEQNENVTITRTFDSLGRLITETETYRCNTPTITKTYTYDIAGNRTRLILRQNNQVISDTTYAYDALNRLIRVYENGSLAVTYTYDINGNRASKVYPNGIRTTYTYNRANLVTSLENRRGTTVLSSFSYAYYLDGNQRQIVESTGRITTYTYDGLGRLTRESETGGGLPNITKSYTFDAAGNRASMTVSGDENFTVIYSYDRNNRLLREVKTFADGGVVTTEYTYDRNGNQLSKTVNDTRIFLTPITTAAITVVAPVTGVARNTVPVGIGNFTMSAVTWSPNRVVFTANTRYTASVTLTANQGFTFSGLTAATINGNGATISNNTGDRVTISFQFPATEPTPITTAAIHVTAPVTGATRSTVATGTGNFTRSAVTWSPNHTVFAASTVYTASVTLTANAGFTFSGLNTATINGNAATITNNTGSNVTLSFQFPQTAAPALTPITTVAVNVTAPVTGAVPNTTATGTGDFTGSTVAWSPNHTVFAASTVYTASVALTANSGFTFSELNTATINGNAATITNNTGSTVTLSFQFPQTAAPALTPITTAAVNVTAPVTGEAPNTTATGTGDFTRSAVTWSPNHTVFAASTVYTASVTLTANAGFTFSGLTTATISGNAATITNNTGSNVTLSFQFPQTAAPALTPITTAAVNVTAPVTGATPNTTATGTGDFTRSTVIWSPNHTVFAASTVYTASVTLTANSGFTFSGLTTATINGNPATISNNTGSAVTLSFQFPPTATGGTPEATHITVYDKYDRCGSWVGIFNIICGEPLFDLVATVYPSNANQTVTWSSNNPLVEVDQNGVVIIPYVCWDLVDNNVIITATAENGVQGWFEIFITLWRSLGEDIYNEQYLTLPDSLSNYLLDEVESAYIDFEPTGSYAGITPLNTPSVTGVTYFTYDVFNRLTNVHRITEWTPITTAAIHVTAPRAGEAPNRTASGTGNFTRSTVTWSPTAAMFAANTRYTATITLTANRGFTFNGLEIATINGRPATITNNTGRTVTISYQFPPTSPAALLLRSFPTFEMIGGGGQITWAILPDSSILTGAVTFHSSDPGVASVYANGSVSANSEGFTEITVTAPTIHGEVQASFWLEVVCFIPPEYGLRSGEPEPLNPIIATDYSAAYHPADTFTTPAAANSGNVEARYTYRPDGLRLSKTVNNNRTTHIWDGANIVAELDNNNAVKYVYVRGIGLIKRRMVGPPSPTPITSAAITVIAPVAGATRNTVATGTGNFTRSAVTWSPNVTVFAADTRYTASVTLTANAGFTFSGLTTATINGNAATISNNTGGAVTLSFQFPPTAAQLPQIVITSHQDIIAPNESFHIGWEILPNSSILTGAVEFHSSDPNVASVCTNGTVIAYELGGTNITITAPTIHGTLSAAFWVEVFIPPRSAMENGEFEAFAADIQPLTANASTVGSSQWYLFNARGDVIALTDAFGHVIREYRYDAFGNEVNPCPNDTNPWRFTGEYFDRETGMIYLRARHFNPRTGRFTQPDPLFWGNNRASLNIYTARQTVNLYAYVMNNPIRFVDPSGESAILALIGLGAKLAAGGGGLLKAGNTVTAAALTISGITSSNEANRQWQEGFSTHTPHRVIEQMPVHIPQSFVEQMPVNPSQRFVEQMPVQAPQPFVERMPVQEQNRRILGGTLVNTGEPGGYIFLASDSSKGQNTSTPRVNTPDQNALIQIAKDEARRGGVSGNDVNTLRIWANEYNVPFHGPEIHLNRPNPFEHIHVGPVNHLRVR